jgi:sulfur-carrier protein
MALQISYFAWVRDRMGCGQEMVQPDAPIATIGDLILWLRDRDARGAAAFADPARIRAAMDGTMVGLDSRLDGAREVALFPPVTGG